MATGNPMTPAPEEQAVPKPCPTVDVQLRIASQTFRKLAELQGHEITQVNARQMVELADVFDEALEHVEAWNRRADALAGAAPQEMPIEADCPRCQRAGTFNFDRWVRVSHGEAARYRCSACGETTMTVGPIFVPSVAALTGAAPGAVETPLVDADALDKIVAGAKAEHGYQRPFLVQYDSDDRRGQLIAKAEAQLSALKASARSAPVASEAGQTALDRMLRHTHRCDNSDAPCSCEFHEAWAEVRALRVAAAPPSAERILTQATASNALRPLDEWHEDDGPVLWWHWPIQEPPWVGTPLDSDWLVHEEGDAPPRDIPWRTLWCPLPSVDENGHFPAVPSSGGAAVVMPWKRDTSVDHPLVRAHATGWNNGLEAVMVANEGARFVNAATDVYATTADMARLNPAPSTASASESEEK